MLPSTELRKRLKDSDCPWELVKAGHHERWELPGGFVFILSQGASAAGHAKQNYLKQIERAETAYLNSLQKAVGAPNPVPLPAPSPILVLKPQPLPLEMEEAKPVPMPVVTPTPDAGLQTFDFGGAPIRVVTKEGDPWWIAADVCAVLTVKNVSDVLNRLDPDEKGDIDSVDAIGRPVRIKVINESGLYNAVLRSEKPEAKSFKKWITSEVLPSIRKKGSYSVKVPFQDMSRLEWIEFALLSEKEKEERGEIISRQQQTIGCQAEEIQVLTEVAEETSAQLERLAGAPIGSLSLREAAKHLKIGPEWFNDWLRGIKWIYRGPIGTPLASQLIINAGWMAHVLREYEKGPSYKMVVVTPAGLVRLAELLEAQARQV